jgi:hypothetical protein
LPTFFPATIFPPAILSTALSRLVPAVVRGDIKPRLTRTVAYMVQTLMQTIHLSQDEYINAFSTDGWRKAVRHSVNSNHDYLFPPDPEPEPQHPETPQSQRTQPQPQQPAQASPQSRVAVHVPASSSVAARLQPAASARATPEPPSADRPSAANPEAALPVARELFPARPSSTPPQSAPPVEACHPERSEGPRLDPAASTTDETRPASAPAPSAQPNSAPPPAPPPPQPRPTTPNHDPYAVRYDNSYRLFVDGKPFQNQHLPSRPASLSF